MSSLFIGTDKDTLFPLLQQTNDYSFCFFALKSSEYVQTGLLWNVLTLYYLLG